VELQGNHLHLHFITHQGKFDLLQIYNFKLNGLNMLQCV
jgi:hypothetical protein